MDPVAHTLVGASLGESGLKDTTRLAMPTLMIGANLPDIDGLVTVLGQNAMYGFRRGWTHGTIALVVLPLVLTGAMVLWARWRSDPPEGTPPLDWKKLLALSYLSVWSHPFLDWLNTYGVRVLMPFDDTWFYGDALFIVDPWMWLLMASAVVLARSQSKMSLGAWSVLGLATTGLVTAVGLVPLGAKIVWGLAVVAIVVARTRPEVVKQSRLVARGALAALIVYIAAMLGGTALARSQAKQWYASQGIDVTRVEAGPLPANPFVRDVIAMTPEGYRFAEIDWLASDPIRETHPPVPKGSGPIVDAAMALPEVAGFEHWLRMPSTTVRPLEGGGHEVIVLDVRYSRSRANIGRARITLDADLKATSVVFGELDLGHYGHEAEHQTPAK